MKYLTSICFMLCISYAAKAQITSGTIFVGGEITKFYPVVFIDGGWFNHSPAVLNIGRSNTHQDSIGSNHRGALMATFTFHLTNWGHGANWIDAFIRQTNPKQVNFIADWKDASTSNSTRQFLIWLRGQTTYQWSMNYATTVTVYDNSDFFEQVGLDGGGITHTWKTAINPEINQQGANLTTATWLTNPGTNFMNGNLGIGTKSTADARLAVNGTINAKKVKVTATGWPDYVFEDDYSLLPPDELTAYIRTHKHLPGVPSADSIHRAGLDLGEMNKALMQKVEELTLYMLGQQEQLKEQAKKIDRLEKAVVRKETE